MPWGREEGLGQFIQQNKIIFPASVLRNVCLSVNLARLLCLWDCPSKNAGAAATSSSRGSSRPRDQTRVSCVSCAAGGLLTAEPVCKPLILSGPAAFVVSIISLNL